MLSLDRVELTKQSKNLSDAAINHIFDRNVSFKRCLVDEYFSRILIPEKPNQKSKCPSRNCTCDIKKPIILKREEVIQLHKDLDESYRTKKKESSNYHRYKIGKKKKKIL